VLRITPTGTQEKSISELNCDSPRKPLAPLVRHLYRPDPLIGSASMVARQRRTPQLWRRPRAGMHTQSSRSYWCGAPRATSLQPTRCDAPIDSYVVARVCHRESRLWGRLGGGAWSSARARCDLRSGSSPATNAPSVAGVPRHPTKAAYTFPDVAAWRQFGVAADVM
jgi:hypothetical protein